VSLKEGRTTTLKFLIACALVTAISQTAVAQRITEKCQKLVIDQYEFGEANYQNIPLYAFIRNDDPYTLTSASFYFDLYIGENFKVGDGSASIGRLMPGITERVPIIYRVDRDIKSYIKDGAIRVTSGINYCTFRQN
jgi:hypothetical protein